ncbi:MAG: Nramp family divalent metal transporter [bacterium]
MSKKFFENLKILGPGFVVAATGIGAGDMIAAAVSGAKYGTVILWSAVLGAVIKLTLNEGIARWQLATGTTLLEGWVSKLNRLISAYFIIYLVLWSFLVAAALIAACGLAAHAIYAGFSVNSWGIIHSIFAVLLVYFGRYALLECLMKVFIALMFIVVLLCAFLVKPDWLSIIRFISFPSVPSGSSKFILGVIGGVGGSVTLLSYGYWIREKQWIGKGFRKLTHLDLGTAYSLIGLFGVAIMIIAAEVNPNVVMGGRIVLEIAYQLEKIVGFTGKWTFLIGCWGAVFSSMLGVWQGIPYLFTDFMLSLKYKNERIGQKSVDSNSFYYKAYLLYLAFPPMLLLLFNKPVWIVIIYSIAGAFFMPFLAGTLLFMNNKRYWVGELKNSWLINILLLISLGLFGYLCLTEIIDLMR